MSQRVLDTAQELNNDRLPPSTSFAQKIVKVIYKELHEQINLWYGHTFSTKHKNMAIQISKQKKDSMMSYVKCNVSVTDIL